MNLEVESLLAITQLILVRADVRLKQELRNTESGVFSKSDIDLVQLPDGFTGGGQRRALYDPFAIKVEFL
uniref:Uncharacterized protein n=1 Tax=Megaselia scalaris TaxID=36166 RepID=T1H2X9_MEGSC